MDAQPDERRATTSTASATWHAPTSTRSTGTAGCWPSRRPWRARSSRELKDFDNLYYEICNEPYFGGVTLAWQHRIADVIVATERDLGARHLISQNIANGKAKVQQPHPNVSIFNFHYAYPPDTVAMNYGLEPRHRRQRDRLSGHQRPAVPRRGLELPAGGRRALQPPRLLVRRRPRGRYLRLPHFTTGRRQSGLSTPNSDSRRFPPRL